MTSTLLQEGGRTTTTQPAAPERKLLHTRRIDCAGYARSDGLYDIEARMQDISPDGTDLASKHVPPGERIHDMRIVMTVDRDMVIHHVEARLDAGPTGYCADVSPFYSALKGLKIGRGFKLKVQELVGGVKGCTHMTELLGPLATTAMQTLFAMQRADGTMRRALQGEGPLPSVLGTCHTYRPDSEALKFIRAKARRAE